MCPGVPCLDPKGSKGNDKRVRPHFSTKGSIASERGQGNKNRTDKSHIVHRLGWTESPQDIVQFM